MKRLRDGARTEGEELLTRVLDECLEEDLSFVPHEREIAGKHRFSPGFEEQMEAMMTEAEQKMQEKELKKITELTVLLNMWMWHQRLLC